MTKPFKINKQNEDVSRLLNLHTGMKLAKALVPLEMGTLGREAHGEMYLSWFSFGKSPRIWSSGNPQAIHQ